MILNVGQITLIDLIGQIERKEVIINRTYQRGEGVWPDSARTYFIDTILEGYPFPKIYLYQVFNEKTKRPIKEIVDGQQRITTIIDFMHDKIRLTSTSKNFTGIKYSDLDEDHQKSFLSYQIELSIILSATRPELLEMFRRINAYTAPLSAAEKRHATFQGAFKWFINEQADKYAPILENLKILTPKQIARMADSEFIADLILALEKGVVAKTAKNIDDLYRKYDEEFKRSEQYGSILKAFFNMLSFDLEPLHDTYMMKSYVVHSLFCAFVQCKYGLQNVEAITTVKPDNDVVFDYEWINSELANLAYAHEAQIETGEYADYVDACLSSTTKHPQRKVRFRILTDVLAKTFKKCT